METRVGGAAPKLTKKDRGIAIHTTESYNYMYIYNYVQFSFIVVLHMYIYMYIGQRAYYNSDNYVLI